MTFGEIARKHLHFVFLLIAALALLPVSNAAFAQPAGSAPPPSNSSAVSAQESAKSPNVQSEAVPQAATAEPGNAVKAAPGASAYKPLGPEWIKGKPTPGAYYFQKQYSADGRYAKWMHNTVLMPIISIITIVVLGLMLFVMFRFRRSANPVPSRTSHNTLIEVIWTIVPALILVVIAVPSMILLNKQYRTAPKNAITIKATGYQWYWGYTYPDNGGFEVISNMLPDAEAEKRGEPEHLGADNRMVVPVGVPIRLQTTGADVIHSFAVPSLWFKIDAVPGRLNERVFTVDEPGIYYGQCSELCGARHGYMPIVVEAVPMAQFQNFIRAQGGTLPGEGAAAAATTPAPAAPAATPSQQPESAIEGAPGAGAAPTTAPSVSPTA